MKRNRIARSFVTILMCVCLLCTSGVTIPSAAAFTEEYTTFAQPQYVDAQLVQVNKDGSLTYNIDPQSGSSLPDYSGVGYQSGQKEIPNVKVVKTLSSGDANDHTEMIQMAINEVSALPESQRGAILLKAGVYIISKSLKISETGVVLRGEGQGINGTIIYDSRKEDVTSLELSGSGGFKVIDGSESEITDSYVPMGVNKIHVSEKDIAKYKVGDSIVITLSPNEKWIQILGADQLSGSGKPWKPEEYVMKYEREILSIHSNEISLDTSVTMSIDENLMEATVSRVEDDGRITESGVENIRFVSFYDPRVEDDENHAWTAVAIKNCRNCWTSDISSYNYAYSCVSVGKGSRNVTVQYCSYLNPISKISGGRRYSFVISAASYTLIKNCYSYDSRHDYVVQARTPGPNVFYSSVADNSNSVSEPHHRWGTGTLYDNVYQVGAEKLGYFEALNRGNSGTGHGWAGANTVFWNCLSPGIIIRKPQTEQNFAIGTYGLYGGDAVGSDGYKNWYVGPENEPAGYPDEKSQSGSPLYGNGYIESWYNPVNPSSLYQAQVSYKVKNDATSDITPPAPILNLPAYDETFTCSQITIAGICDLNAEKVIISIDGKETEFVPNKAMGSGEFSVELELNGGYHNITVSQMIAGFRSDKTPSRTIYINNGDKFDKPVKDLQSILIDRGNTAAIEIRDDLTKRFMDEIIACEEMVLENYDQVIESLLWLEESISKKNAENISLASQDIGFYVSMLETSIEDMQRIANEAKTSGCDDASMEEINASVAKAEKYLSNANIIKSRGQREVENGSVDSFSYEEELKQVEKKPYRIIYLIIIGAVVLAVILVLLLLKRIKHSQNA